MTPDGIYDYFVRLTDLEKDFLNGCTDTNPQNFPFTSISGECVLKPSFQNPSDMVILCPNILVIKHSRFQDYPPHLHDWIEIAYMLCGSSRQALNHTPIELSQGQALLMDSDTIHKIYPLDTDDLLINIIINKSYFNSTFFNRINIDSEITNFFFNSLLEGALHNNYILFHSENSRRLPIFMQEFLSEWISPSRHAAEILNNLLALIVTELINIFEHEYQHSQKHHDKPGIVHILKYIETNYKSCTLSDTANFFNMNANYLSMQLKKYTGFSFLTLLHQQKINAACTLLKNTDLPVSEIIHYIGYENMSFFYKKFKEHCGCLPGEYREQNALQG